MKYLIFGKGYVAGHFKSFFGDGAEFSSVRIENYNDVKRELEEKKPEIVINTAGKTGRPNIDWCEEHKVETLNSNTIGPLVLLRACQELGQYWVHVGSGCVYTSKTTDEVYSEDDAPNFFGSFYSKTKIWSEQVLKEFPVLQLRLRMPIDSEPSPRNFITKITKYDKVINIPNSMSVLDDFVKVAVKLMDKKATGIYNMTNSGYITHGKILDIYKEVVDPNFSYKIFPVEEMNKITKAGRSNCILSTEKLKKEGIEMRPIEEAVRDTLKIYKEKLQAQQQDSNKKEPGAAVC